MRLDYAKAKAKYYQARDKRLSREVALVEAWLEQIIIDLDNKDKIPQNRIASK